MLVFSSISDDKMYTTWPFANTMVPGQKIDSLDNAKIIIA